MNSQETPTTFDILLAVEQRKRQNKPPRTRFDAITESPGKLAEVISAIAHGYWAGVTITDDPEKWLEWLNEPEKEEGAK